MIVYFQFSINHNKNMQILELGIVLHTIILGISIGVSRSPKTIKPLVAVLTFHQCFEGIGLGGCISQVLLIYIYVSVFLFNSLYSLKKDNFINTYSFSFFFIRPNLNIVRL